jgi:hypothetical protein
MMPALCLTARGPRGRMPHLSNDGFCAGLAGAGLSATRATHRARQRFRGGRRAACLQRPTATDVQRVCPGNDLGTGGAPPSSRRVSRCAVRTDAQSPSGIRWTDPFSLVPDPGVPRTRAPVCADTPTGWQPTGTPGRPAEPRPLADRHPPSRSSWYRTPSISPIDALTRTTTGGPRHEARASAASHHRRGRAHARSGRVFFGCATDSAGQHRRPPPRLPPPR